jgi:serine/threonine-protein kinase HipA
MAVNGKYKDFTVDDIMKTADRFGVGEAKQLIKDVREVIQSWPLFAKRVGLSKEEIKRIADQHILL